MYCANFILCKLSLAHESQCMNLFLVSCLISPVTEYQFWSSFKSWLQSSSFAQEVGALPCALVSVSQPLPQWQYFSATTITPFVKGQNRDSVPSLIYFSFSLLTLIYHDLKSQMAFFLLLSGCACRALVQSSSLRPDPIFSKVVWSFRLSTSLVSSKRRTRCNFLLILSSPLLRNRAPLPADGGREGRVEEWGV